DALTVCDPALRNRKGLTNINEAQLLRLPDSIHTEGFAPLSAPEIDRIANTYPQRASIAAADRNIRIQKLRESGARGSWIPTVSVGASFANSGVWANGARSEERRVGKEGRGGGWRWQ